VKNSNGATNHYNRKHFYGFAAVKVLTVIILILRRGAFTLQEFKDKEFNEFLQSKKNGLVLFSAPWCTACKVVTPIIEKIVQANDKLTFAKIDVSKNPGLASRMNVMSLPNIIIFNKGRVAEQVIGSTNQKNIEDKLKKIS